MRSTFIAQTGTVKTAPQRLLAGSLVLTALVLAACGSSGSASTATTTAKSSGSGSMANASHDLYLAADLLAPAAALTGAGSTFDQPVFTKAFYEYNLKNQGLTVNYAAIGSGGGIAQLEANTVAFGASDVPMSAGEMGKATGGAVLQAPVALGGVSISYNLPGIKSGVKMTSDILAGIYSGAIKTWDDPQLKTLNPTLNLPSQPITTVHRADGSGTTYIFTDYLSTVAPSWASGPGKGKSVSWPDGIAGQGNAGVAGIIKQTPYSLGYVELAYALQNNFTYVQLQNASGHFVYPTQATVGADAAQKPNVTSADFTIVNQQGANSYPISGYSWVLIYKQQTDDTKGTAVVKVFDWLTHAQGQEIASTLGYVSLPANIQALARQTLLQVVGTSGNVLLTTK